MVRYNFICLNSYTFKILILKGLMPYNYICVETGTTLSSLTSLDDLLSPKTLLSMGIAAIVALLPGYLIKRRQNKKELSKIA